MPQGGLNDRFRDLSTPVIADACVRLKIEPRVAPPGLRPLVPGTTLAGRVLPCRHVGSVDIFLEAMEHAKSGDVLVIDNDGRSDEGCIGDLTALEAMAVGIEGLVVWGHHRDTPELRDMRLPVFSYGTCPVGPLRVDARPDDALAAARFGDLLVTSEDCIFADDDGALFVPLDRVDDVLEKAGSIQDTEREQAEKVRTGTTLREQLRFHEYLNRRARDRSYTFRAHLRKIGGAIEE